MKLDTNTLKINDTFKNYKELCAYLGEEPKKANSKVAQLKEWERYFSFRKEGQKIIITRYVRKAHSFRCGMDSTNNVYVGIENIHILWYSIRMENKYRHTNTTVSLINYHFVFCPRYRRKIFLIPNVEKRFKELVKIKCKELEIEIIAIECDKDHSHMFLNCLPTLSPSDIMQQIKGYTSKILREEFSELSKMPSLWTRSYFVSTAGNVCSETIKKYVENQKKRY